MAVPLEGEGGRPQIMPPSVRGPYYCQPRTFFTVCNIGGAFAKFNLLFASPPPKKKRIAKTIPFCLFSQNFHFTQFEKNMKTARNFEFFYLKDDYVDISITPPPPLWTNVDIWPTPPPPLAVYVVYGWPLKQFTAKFY